MPRLLYPPGKEPAVPIEWETGWAPEPIWTHRRRENSCTVRNRTRAVRHVSRYYTDWAISTPSREVSIGKRGGSLYGRMTVTIRQWYFFGGVCEAIGTVATPGLLCQPRVIVKMIVEKQMECRLARGTEVLGENLSQRHFCPSQNPTWPDPGLNQGRRGGMPATNRLSYGAARQWYCRILDLWTT
jgi:hypothetical protein